MKTFVHLKDLYPPQATLDCRETPDGRFYKSPTTNLWYPSVTTVTGDSKKDFFKTWRENPENEKNLAQALIRGNELHAIVEKYLGNDPEYTKDHNPAYVGMVEKLQKHIDKIDNIWMQETALWSDYMKMAGRVDCIGHYNGTVSIIDFKGSNKPKQEKYIQHYFQQTCCYALMFQDRYGVSIDQIVVLVASENGTVQEFVKKPKPYLRDLRKTIDAYWKTHDFQKIQEAFSSCEKEDLL